MDAFVEGGQWTYEFLADSQNLKWIEHHVPETMGDGEVHPYMDLSNEMEAFFPPKTAETKDTAAMQAVRVKLVRNLSENLRKGERAIGLAKGKKTTVKKAIGALKFVLPVGLSTAAIFIPVLGGAVAASAVAWQTTKILDFIKKLRDDIDGLTTSDYKSTMLLFKDILITLAHDVDPDLDDVKHAYRKAIDGYTKLDQGKVQEKMELIKIQMFCTVYINCFDRKSCSMLPFDAVPEARKNIIQDIFNDRLKDLQNLCELNHLEYYTENCYTACGNLHYQTMLDGIDHIKRISYSSIIIIDTVYQVNNSAVKVWSLKGFMIPEGENDALSSSLNIITPTSDTDADELTIQASIYKDKGRNWFLKVHLPSEEDYEDLTVLCKYQVDGRKSAIFLPSKINSKSWKVDTSFLSNHDGTVSFLMCKAGNAKTSLSLGAQQFQSKGILDHMKSFGPDQCKIVRQYFAAGEAILEKKSILESVMTVIGLMNLTDSTIPVSPPAFVSGCTSSGYPWPSESPPLRLVDMVSRKMKFSTAGSVGATVLKLSSSLNLMIYWCTPYDHNLYENCFGIGHYSSDSPASSESIQSLISSLPGQPPEGVLFELHQAKDGPVCIDLPNSWSICVRMTTDHKASVDIILYSV